MGRISRADGAMTERKPDGMSWETFVEHQIRRAQENGEFDELPGFGQPLAELDEPYDDNWWVKKKLRRENLSLLPPALQIQRDVEQTLQSIWQLEDAVEVRETLEALNARIRKALMPASWGPPSTMMPVDIDALLSQWHARRGQH